MAIAIETGQMIKTDKGYDLKIGEEIIAKRKTDRTYVAAALFLKGDAKVDTFFFGRDDLVWKGSSQKALERANGNNSNGITRILLFRVNSHG